MRYTEAAELQLWLDAERMKQERRDAELVPAARHAREATRSPSLRQRAGEAVIAFGVRLAGERRPTREDRRLVTRAT